MQDEDLELLEEFVIESRELLESAEADLMALDVSGGGAVEPDVINRIFRAVHSVKGAAGFFGMEVVGSLAHALESVLMKVRDGEMEITSDLVDIFLHGNDRLRALVDDIHNSNDQDVSNEVAELKAILAGESIAAPAPAPAAEPEPQVSIPGLDAAGLDLDDLPELLDPGVPGNFILTDAVKAELKRNGRNLYELTVRCHEDLDLKDRSASQFIEEMGVLGDVLGCSPAPESISEGAYSVHVSTVLDSTLAPEAFDLAQSQVLHVAIDPGKAKKPTPAPQKKAKPEPAAPAPEKKAAKKKSASSSSASKSATQPETVRVKTSVLNALMEMAGELVLARNRLVRTLDTHVETIEGLGPVLGQVSTITTSVQEQIMRTRLQPVGSLFGKFRRVVRDVSHKLGKEVILETRGGDVELDRTILEGLSDPLTHLVRNSLDHGLELPDERERLGKRREGRLRLSAFHVAGMVNIDVEDDGAGIDVDRVVAKAMERGLLTEEQAERLGPRERLALIFNPGFSTAKEVTDVSGRGVGMDVVRTNIEKLGGTVDLGSERGVGTTITLKLPLTLAIVSSLIVEVEQQRFALPQVGLQEVVRLRPGEGSEVIEEVRGAAVLRHRGALLPIVRLSDVLGLQRTFIHPETGERMICRRDRLVDRRDQRNPPPQAVLNQRTGEVRRASLSNVQRILVIKVGRNRYGILVDKILDNEEIVVKPLSRFVSDAPCFSGATILGDGTIAMILDPVGMAQQAKLSFDLGQEEGESTRAERDRDLREAVSLVLFRNGTQEIFALPLGQTARIEKIEASSIQTIGGAEFLSYLGRSLPLVRLESCIPVEPPMQDPEELYILIPNLPGQPVGLVATEVVDAREIHLELDSSKFTHEGLFGSTILDGQIVLVVDLHRLSALAQPELVPEPPQLYGEEGPLEILLAEDTPAYQGILRSYLERSGANVTLATDGDQAWDQLRSGSFDVLVTDQVMPRIRGNALVSRVRSHNTLARTPAIILGQVTMAEDPLTLSAGKLDANALTTAIHSLLEGVA